MCAARSSTNLLSYNMGSKCDNETFIDRGGVTTHTLADTGLHECSQCSKTFTVARSLRTHLLTHREEKPHKCSVCSKGFKRSTHLKQHMTTHAGDKVEKPHKCSVCSKSFQLTAQLKQHMATHTGDKRFKCSQCEKAFLTKAELTRHFMIHSGEQPHKCPVCGHGFSLPCNLKRHMVVHTGDKLHKCSVCSKSFTLVSNLKRHMDIHKKEKSHTCSLCSKSFNRSGHLKRHMFQHTGEKPHRCFLCSMRFIEATRLKLHMFTHVKKKRKDKKSSSTHKTASTQPRQKAKTITARGRQPDKCPISSTAFAGMETYTGGDTKQDYQFSESFNCYECVSGFQDIVNLQNHLRGHLFTKKLSFVKLGMEDLPLTQSFGVDTDLDKCCKNETDSIKDALEPADIYMKPTYCGAFGVDYDVETYVDLKPNYSACDICVQGFLTPTDLQNHISIHLVI